MAEKMRVQGFHYPFPANGFVEKDGNGYPLVPALAVLPHLSKGRPVRAPFVFWLDRETAGPYSPRP